MSIYANISVNRPINIQIFSLKRRGSYKLTRRLRPDTNAVGLGPSHMNGPRKYGISDAVMVKTSQSVRASVSKNPIPSGFCARRGCIGCSATQPSRSHWQGRANNRPAFLLRTRDTSIVNNTFFLLFRLKAANDLRPCVPARMRGKAESLPLTLASGRAASVSARLTAC